MEIQLTKNEIVAYGICLALVLTMAVCGCVESQNVYCYTFHNATEYNKYLSNGELPENMTRIEQRGYCAFCENCSD